LSNSQKKKEYDSQRRSVSKSQLYNPLIDPSVDNSHSSEFSEPQSDPDTVFESVFEELLIPELGGSTNGIFWRLVGGISGSALGFIMANVPGAVGGWAAGSFLGTVRDRKGKSVLSAFNDLPIEKKAAILAALAKKVYDIGANASGAGPGTSNSSSQKK
jgi:hypothetical protein